MSLLTSPHMRDALQCLSVGGVLAYPTEGVFGLGCDARDADACARVIALKQRDPEQGMIVLVDDLRRIGRWLQPLNAQQQQRLLQAQNQFITWLMPATDTAPAWIRGAHTSLAVRIPNWPPLRALCEQFAQPLVSTSANPHGLSAVTDSTSVCEYFTAGVDLVWSRPCGGREKPSHIFCLASGQQLR